MVAADVRQRTEAVQFRLKDEIRMIERLWDALEPHGDERHGRTRALRSYQLLELLGLAHPHLPKVQCFAFG